MPNPMKRLRDSEIIRKRRKFELKMSFINEENARQRLHKELKIGIIIVHY